MRSKNLMLSLWVISSFLAGIAQADPVCDIGAGNLRQCIAEQAQVRSELERLQARLAQITARTRGLSGMSELLGVEREVQDPRNPGITTGHVLHPSQYSAFNICISKNRPEVRTAVAAALGYTYNQMSNRWDMDPLRQINLDALPLGAYYLPTVEELREYHHASRDSFNGEYFYWSSSIYKPNSNLAESIHGNHSETALYERRYVHGDYVARCARSR